MVSFWEQQSFLDFDVIIVGAGITGLSTAASLKEQNPKLEVLVVERGTLPTGASTRNAGFACFGSISELANDQIALGNQGMVALVKKRWDGLQKTIARLGADQIGLAINGGYELLSAEQETHLFSIDKVNALLQPLFDQPVFSRCDDLLPTFGFGQITHLIYNRYEGQLHTGKLIRSLWNYCTRLGVQVLTGTEVTKIEPGTRPRVQAGELAFTGQAVVVCTNAFTPSLITKPLDITPGRGMVMVVRPEKPLPFRGTFHYEEGYYYFRDFGPDRLIFGGGRNLALAEEQTTAFGINPRIEEKLHRDLQQIILPKNPYTVEMQWSGIMAFGATKRPLVQQLEEGVYLGARLGGMGVAIGSLVGEELAHLVLKAHF